MKKKLLLVLSMVALLICIFAISVSAEEVFTLTTNAGDKETGDTVALWADGEGLVWYLNDENKLVSAKSSELTLEYEAQDQVYTQIGNLPAVNGAQCLKAIKVGDTVIQSIDGTKKIVVANLKDLAFEYIYTSGTTTVFANNSTLQCVYLPDTVKRLANYSFYNCSALTSFDMGNSVQIIWDSVFAGATALERVDYSNTCLYMGSNVFQNATSLKVLSLGESMQYLPSNFMSGTGTQLIDIYIPTTITNFGAPYNNFLTIFYTGTLEQAQTKLPTFNVVKYTYIPYSEYDGLHTTEELKWIAYYDVNVCDAYYKGVHDYTDDGDCTTDVKCTRCQNVVVPAYDSHNNSVQISYANGYHNAGSKITGCTNEGCTHNTTEELSALFTCLGYSAPEDGDGGISIRYTVNATAIAEYENVTGATLSYGMFATTKQAIGNSDIFDTDGNTVNGAISLDVTKSNFTFIALKMVGFETEESKKAEFAIGAYVVTTENGEKSCSYLQYGTPVNGEKYAYIKYNDFVSTNS